MRQDHVLSALLAIGVAAVFAGSAAAGGCGNCGYTGYYTVQPELIVRRPLVIRKPYVIPEYVPCGNGYVINQGQYHTDAALIARPRCLPAPAWPSLRSGYQHRRQQITGRHERSYPGSHWRPTISGACR